MDAAETRPYRRLSANLPQHWLLEVRFMRLSHAAWRMYTYGLMWAIGQTDGDIPKEILSTLLPGADKERQLALEELLEAGLLVETPAGWRVPDWLKNQSSVAQIEANRATARLKKRHQRERQRDQRDRSVPPGIPPGTSLGQ